MRLPRKIPGVRIALLCAALALLGGCAGSQLGKGQIYYAVSGQQAQVYRFGPSQPTGADALLKKGQRIIMLRQEYGFSRVMTEDGMTGFIANDLIAPAPPPPKPITPTRSAIAFANLPPLPSRGGSVPGVSSANRAIMEHGPLFGEDPLPALPEGDGRSDSRPKNKAPGFRFNVHAPSSPPAENPQ